MKLNSTTPLTYLTGVGAPIAFEGKRDDATVARGREHTAEVYQFNGLHVAEREKEDMKETGSSNPVLVTHCRDTKLTWSRVSLRKGVDPHSVKVGRRDRVHEARESHP